MNNELMKQKEMAENILKQTRQLQTDMIVYSNKYVYPLYKEKRFSESLSLMDKILEVLVIEIKDLNKKSYELQKGEHDE